jgi:hypothetical protein
VERDDIRWDDHELLERESTTGVGPTVENVHEGYGKNVGLLGASEVGDVDVEWDALAIVSVLLPLTTQVLREDCLSSFVRLRHSPQELTLVHTFSAAAAFATAMETPRMALAPSLFLVGVPA